MFWRWRRCLECSEPIGCDDARRINRRRSHASGDAVNGRNQMLLRTATGHDFSLYKKSTIGRRIERRMAQHDLSDMAVYARFLKSHPAEVKRCSRNC